MKAKSLLSFLFLLVSTLVCFALVKADDASLPSGVVNHADTPLSLIVISDTHIMAPELLMESGKAFEDYVANDRKMLRESPALMEEMTQKILAARPQFVLIPGDLTKDGERVSHLYLRDNYLRRLREAGIGVFVIPGNHDVDNPHAVQFMGEKTERVATPKASEFAEIYEDYGYGAAIARDSTSLSYVVQLSNDTRLIAIDACLYYENSYEENTCVTGGRLRPATIAFIEEQATAAKASDMRLIAMMHHGVVEHWKWQEKVMGEYLVEDWEKFAKLFAKLGIDVVFTGHFHAQDIARRNSLYDVETGSLVSYPSPYRMVALQGDSMTIETHYLEGSLIDGISDLQEYAKDFAAAGVCSIIGRMLPKEASEGLRDSLCRELGSAYIAHLAGNEVRPEGNEEVVKDLASRLKPYSWKLAYAFRHIVKNLFTDNDPEDNNIVIELRTRE